MNKDIVPENFTMGLALFDAVPVILFGVASMLLWKLIGGGFLFVGALVCFVSGMLKVLWKIIVVLKKKNVWPLFLQMRIGMPLGFMIMFIGFVITGINGTLSSFINVLLSPFPFGFLILTITGMTGMILCGSKLDSSSAKANWVEQICNTFAQANFLFMVLVSSSYL